MERKNELGVGFLLKLGLLEVEFKVLVVEIGNKWFYWVFWVVSDVGDEVEEINCMINFDKWFNKVKLLCYKFVFIFKIRFEYCE